MDQQAVIDDTRRWILSIVIGLNLCPFAKRVFQEDKIRYVVTDACDRAGLLAALGRELNALASEPIATLETTFLIHPLALAAFLDYNDFLGDGDDLLDQLGLSGVIQIASFHPDYQFACAKADAVEHYTNRSPFPMLHLLREASVEAVANDPEMLADIPRRNIDTLKSLGRVKVLAMLRDNAKESRHSNPRPDSEA